MFTLGFKTAAFDHSNQGLEFKMNDDGGAGTGAAAMAPSGIESYQPVEANEKGGQPKKKRTLREAAMLIYKTSGSDIADGVASGLKYTFENGIDTPEQQADRAQETRNRRKAFLRASLK